MKFWLTVSTIVTGDVITKAHMDAMKNNAVLCNMGHFDSEIQVESLKEDTTLTFDNIKPHVDHITWPDGKCVILLAEGRQVNMLCSTGHSSFVMSISFTNQVGREREGERESEREKVRELGRVAKC